MKLNRQNEKEPVDIKKNDSKSQRINIWNIKNINRISFTLEVEKKLRDGACEFIWNIT